MPKVDELYPYDPELSVSMFHDLEKLRCVADRGLAQLLLDLWPHAVAYDMDHRKNALEKAKVERASQDEREWAEALMSSAQNGEWGIAGKQAWNTVTNEGHNTSLGAAKELASQLSGLPRRGAR